MLQHLKEPWLYPDLQQLSHFCESGDCDVVYFNQDGSTFLQSNVRIKVGLKNPGPHSIVCYCFDIISAVASENPSLRAFVIQQTKAKLCACAVRNPSGQCCLKYFPTN